MLGRSYINSNDILRPKLQNTEISFNTEWKSGQFPKIDKKKNLKRPRERDGGFTVDYCLLLADPTEQ